jgi:NitT/TauT family transport system permease protein
LPSPAEVWRAIPDLLHSAGLGDQTATSLRRVLISFLWALVIAIPLGVAMGSFGSVGAMFSPIATASSYIPIATLVPLTMSWFGTGELAKEFFLAMAFGISLLPAVVKAIESVPDVYLRTAYTLGASRAQTVFRVLIPIAAPDIWHGMRLSFGVGWTYLTIAEALSYDGGGLGALVEVSRRLGKRERIYITIAVITLIAWGFDLAWRKLGQFLFRYRSATP